MKFNFFGFVVSNELETKTFGLAQAEAAMRYITDPSHVRPVLGAICGVLGY